MRFSWVLQGKNKPALSWLYSHTVGKYLALDNPSALKKKKVTVVFTCALTFSRIQAVCAAMFGLTVKLVR